MSIAVCLKCGGMKHDPLVPCSSCGHQPQDLEDAARHLLLTDAYLTRAQLEKVSDMVRHGQSLHFDEKAVRERVAWVRRTFGRRRIHLKW